MALVTSCKNDLYPDLCSATSSVWNFCAGFSDVISRENQWWRHEMSAVFSDLSLIHCEKQRANIFTIKVFKVVRKEILFKKQISS